MKICFSSILKTFRKIEKIEVFAHCGPVDIFLLNSHQMKWKYDGFLHFRKLFKKLKMLKFSPTLDLSTDLAQFTHVHIFLRNEWFFCISKTFQKKRLKFLSSVDLSTLFWLTSHMCTFFIQMSEFLYFSYPEVKISWFFSFSKTFQKIKKKIEVFAHRESVRIFASIHTCAHFSSKTVDFYILVVL